MSSTDLTKQFFEGRSPLTIEAATESADVPVFIPDGYVYYTIKGTFGESVEFQRKDGLVASSLGFGAKKDTPTQGILMALGALFEQFGSVQINYAEIGPRSYRVEKAEDKVRLVQAILDC